nr:AI-2E family transporter [Allonocardiopsis opalescens]
MPPWVPRALVLAMATVAAFGAGWWLLVRLEGLLTLVLVSLFLALAIEPAVNWLAAQGWPRAAATGVVFVVLLVLLGTFFTVLGSMLVAQIVNLAADVPQRVGATIEWLNDSFDLGWSSATLVDQLRVASTRVQDYATSLAGGVWGASTTVLGLVFQGLTVMLFTFYLAADGPRFRRAVCSVLTPQTQREVLRAWEIAITKTGGYIYSRGLLALICGLAHYVFFTLIDLPFAFALAVWVGVLSQFIPTVGTYLGGLMPILIGLLDDPWSALWVLLFIVAYQQVENYWLQPKITARTLDMHPAVAFAAVIAGAAILGPHGALLALPAGASLQAFLSNYIRRYKVEEHPLVAPQDRGDASPAAPARDPSAASRGGSPGGTVA